MSTSSNSEEISSHSKNVEQIRCRGLEGLSNLQYRDTLAGAHNQLNVHDMSDDSLNVDVGSCSSAQTSSGCAEVINLSLSSEPSRAETVGRRMSVISDSSSHTGISTRVDDRIVADDVSDGAGGDHDKRVYGGRKLYYRRREVLRPDAVPVYRLPQVAPSITW